MGRREFLAAGLRIGAGIAVGSGGCLAAGNTGDRSSLRGKVVTAQREGIAAAAAPDLRKWATDVLNRSVCQLTGRREAREAWCALFKPSDRVGIKINALAGPRLCPRPGVVEAIVAGLRQAGVEDENIIIWDRFDHELEACGYELNRRGGVRCFGTDALRGSGYEGEISTLPHMGSCFSMILTRLCTALVNVPVLKDHDLAGVSGAMKNLYGVIHNPNKYHLNNCDPYVAELSTHPEIRGKLRLNVCDAIRPQYDGGPSYKPRLVWPLDMLLVSGDSVAIDRVSQEIIEAKRRAKGLPTLEEAGHPPKHIDTAAALDVGEGDPSRIVRLEA